MAKVTIYPSGTDATNGTIIDSDKIVEMIRDGKWSKMVNDINSLEYNSKEQKALKVKLHAIVWQGVFKKRNIESIVEHSGLVACDFDHIPDDEYKSYWDTLTGCEYVYALFRSPRRDGLKAIFKIPADIENHKYYLAGLKNYFRDSKYYDHYDDICRVCFASYDPDIYFNPNAKEFTVKIYPKRENKDVNTAIPEQYKSIFNRLVLWLEKTEHYFYVDGNKHNYLVRLFSACQRYGILQDAAVDMAYELCSNIEGVEQVPYNNFEKIAKNVYQLYSHTFGISTFTPDQIPNMTIDVVETELKKVSFPIDVFPESVTNYINELNGCLNYPKDFLSISAMWTLATINGNKYKLRVKNGWIAPTVFWFAAVGEPGTMKSHPIETIIDPIKRIDQESKAIYDKEFEVYEANESKGIKPKYKQILVSDSTLEAIHIIHSINKRGIGLFKDELVGFLNDMNRYRKGSDEQFWLESFNNKSYVVNRVTREPILINDTMINILGGIQPTVLTKITREYSGNGMIDRFLFTTNETGIYPISKKDIGIEWMNWWKQCVMDLNNYISYIESTDTIYLNLTEDAMDMMIEIDSYFCTIQKSDDETNALKGYISKIKTYLPRFALLMWIFDMLFKGGSLEVTADHMARAKKICDYFIASAKYVFTESETRQEIESVTSKMNGSTKIEKIIALAAKGFKQVEIARQLSTPKSYVSKVLKESKVIHE